MRRDHRATPMEIIIHLLMAPRSSGTYSWQLAPEKIRKLAEDLRWTILRKIFPVLNGKSPYGAMLQKHAISVESLDPRFFEEILEVIRCKYQDGFDIGRARDMEEIELIEEYFIPAILEWADPERSTSVSREKTPSIEDLITQEDSSGNSYQRFPDEFSWVLAQNAPDIDKSERREIPEEMKRFVHRIAIALTDELKNIYNSGKLDKYLILMSRLEDDICTWEMTYDYLNSLGVNKYSSWKSLSVVANRTLKRFVGNLPDDVRCALHQDDPELSREEKHARLRLAVTAALELNPLPTPMEVLAEAAC